VITSLDSITVSGALPIPLTPLLGRESEVAAVSELFTQSDVRLVTLTGPGGVGKTRLAIEVAEHVAGDFRHGIAFVGLSSIRGPGLVAPAIARSLGLSEGGDEILTVRLAAVLREKHLLLVLDNFEQVVDAAGVVADLLLACPGLKILVTSRMRLRLSGEYEHPVPPLGLATTQGTQLGEDSEPADAVRLFVERAQAVQPSFALTADNSQAVSDICRRLDGLPLALELAAAWVKVLSPQALLARLENRLLLLTGGGRDLPERQQTMRATINWSYNLLPPNEQLAFRRLAVFAGGFTMEAAESVLDWVNVSETSVLDAVASLVEKSLLVRQDGHSGEPRFLMLDTVREFALEELANSGDQPVTRGEHASWFLNLAEGTAPALRSRQSNFPSILDRLEVEHANFREAMSASLASEQTAGTALAIAGALNWYWFFRGFIEEGLEWLMRSLDATTAPSEPPIHRIRALAGASLFANLSRKGRADGRSQRMLEEAEYLAIAAGETWFRGYALYQRGWLAINAGQFAEAALLLEQSLTEFEVAQIPDRMPLARWELGRAAFGAQNFIDARRHFEASLSMFEDAGDSWGISLARRFLGLLALVEDDIDTAAELIGESLAYRQKFKVRDIDAQILGCVATVAAAAGIHRRAAILFGATTGIGTDLGWRLGLPEWSMFDRAETETRSALGDRLFAEAWEEGRGLSPERAFSEAETTLAELNLSMRPASTPPNTFVVTSGLSAREVDVLRLLAEGLSDREIAAHLYIGVRTVQTHVHHLLRKLEVTSRTEAATLAIRNNLV
jgi:predicted ATPase/DNA-binding CsgD family transcriptional regulator